MSGLSRLRNMFRVPDLRNKILFTIFIIGTLYSGSSPNLVEFVHIRPSGIFMMLVR